MTTTDPQPAVILRAYIDRALTPDPRQARP
jgi:hypothetical protein